MKNITRILNMVMVGLWIIVVVIIITRYNNTTTRERPFFDDKAGAETAIGPAFKPNDGSNLANLPPFPINNSKGGVIQRLAVLNTIIPNRPRVDVSTYEVQQGDTLFTIAESYGLKPETVLWGNYDVLKDNPQFLRPGQELNILPDVKISLK